MAMDRNHYDPNDYKPKSEQLDYNSPMSKVASKNFLNEEHEFLKNTNARNFKGRITFEDYSVFVPLDPMEPLSGNASRRLNKTILFVGIFAAVWLAITILTFSAFRALLRLPFIVTVLIYIIVGALIAYTLVTKFIYKTEEKRRDMAMHRGNKSMNLGNVWGINPGGISEGKAMGKKHTSVYYKGKEAIVLKLLKKSVLVTGEMADWAHYEGLQYLEDIMTKADFSWTQINMKYDTENDYIWDELNDSLLDSSRIYGKEYTDIMNEIFVFQRNFTKAVSTVPVIYYIIKPEYVNTKKNFKDLMSELVMVVNQQCRCTLEPVSNKEFLRLLKDYYGVSYLDIDSISEFISTSGALNIDVSVVKYLNNKGELVKIKDEYVPDLPNKFTRVETILKEKDIIREPEVEISKEFSIFGDKNIRQFESQ